LVVPHPLVPIDATGSVLFDYRGEQQSGNVEVQGNRSHRFLLRVTSRVLGTAALEVRFSDHELLVVDFGSETYFLGENSAEHRIKLFSIDMTPDEFLMVLTARIPQPAFARGGGHFEQERFAAFGSAQAEYRFELDGEGLPNAWRKIEEGRTQWRVEYREYQDVSVGSGALRLPRKVRVYGDANAARLVLGIREFQLWNEPEPSAHLTFDPPVGMRFQPLEERAPTGALP
jgi:hypothetical protein